MKFMDQIHRDHPISDLKIVFGDSISSRFGIKGCVGKHGEECFGNLLNKTTAKKLLELHESEAKLVLRKTKLQMMAASTSIVTVVTTT